MGRYTGKVEELGDLNQYDARFNRICDGIGLSVYKRTDDRLVKKLSYVINLFARKAKAQDPVSILVQFEKWAKEHAMSPSYKGEQIIDPVYQSLRLAEDRSTLADRMAVETKLSQKIDEKQKHIEQRVSKEAQKLEELKTQAASEKAERIRLEVLYKEQTGQDFDYNAVQGGQHA